MRVAIIFVLFLSVGIAATGCGQRQAVNSTMSNEEQGALKASLAKLEDTLKSESSFIFDKLAPGATEQEIDTLRSKLGGIQIECLEIWYRWHNGCTDRLTDVLPLGRMLSIAEALDDKKLTQSLPFVDAKRKSALKILDDSAGDGFFLDIATTSPRVFYHMLEDPFPRDYGTFQEFVTFVDDVHAAGLASNNEHGTVSFDLDRYQKIEAEYLEKVRIIGE